MEARANRFSRILILCREFPAHSETFITEHVRAMLQKGWQVTVGATYLFPELFPELMNSVHLEDEKLEILQLPEVNPGRNRILRNVVGASKLLRHPRLFLRSGFARWAAVVASQWAPVLAGDRFDVIHAHYGNHGVAAALALDDGTARLITSFHGFDLSETALAPDARAHAELLRGATIVVHSEYIRNLLLERTGLNARVISFGIDRDLFDPPEQPPSEEGPVKILFVGRLEPIKGARKAINALVVLNRPGEREYRLRVIGDGSERPALARLVEECGLQEQVTFSGAASPSEVARAMCDSRLMLIPSQKGARGVQEAFSRAAMEGLAMGLPVVHTPSGGLPETVGQGGTLAKNFTADAIVDAVNEALTIHTPQQWRDLCLRRAAHFSFEAMADAYDRTALERLNR